MPDDPRALPPRAPDSAVPTDDARRGMRWWNAAPEPIRRFWMQKAGNTGRAVDAWKAFKQYRKAAAGIGTAADVP